MNPAKGETRKHGGESGPIAPTIRRAQGSRHKSEGCRLSEPPRLRQSDSSKAADKTYGLWRG